VVVPVHGVSDLRRPVLDEIGSLDIEAKAEGNPAPKNGPGVAVAISRSPAKSSGSTEESSELS
jgi:hypothetical protein